jgi:hypothetical protein
MGSRACWIDPEELASLGAELTGAERSPELEAEESVPLDLFGEPVGEPSAPLSGGGMRTDQTAAQRVGERLAEIRRRAESSGLLRSSPNVGAAEDGVDVGPAPGEGDSLVERLESLVHWATGQSALTGLFVADFSGNELVESGADPALVASGVALADGWERARGELESTAGNGVSTAASVRDREGAVLTVFSCRSAYGQHVLGALSGEPLAPAVSVGLRSGLARVMGQPVDV